MLSQRQRLILQLAKLSPLQLPSLCRSSPHFIPSSSLPCRPLPCKIIYCSANDAHRVGFVVFHNLRNQPVELPCQHPSSLSLAPSLPRFSSLWLRRHARFRAFACVVHIWQHVACLSSPQLTNGCLSGENMFLRNFIRLHLDPRHSPFPLSPHTLCWTPPRCQCYCLMSGCWPFFIVPLFVVAAMAANGVTSLVER